MPGLFLIEGVTSKLKSLPKKFLESKEDENVAEKLVNEVMKEILIINIEKDKDLISQADKQYEQRKEEEKFKKNYENTQ